MTNTVIKCQSKNTSILSSLDDFFKLDYTAQNKKIVHVINYSKLINVIISILERNIYLILMRSIIIRGKTGICKKRKNVLNGERGIC